MYTSPTTSAIYSSSSSSSSRSSPSSSSPAPATTTSTSPIERLLHDNGFGDRLIKLDSNTISARPILAEAYQEGSWRPCIITGLVPPDESDNKNKKKKTKNAQPKLEVSFIPLSSEDGSDGNGGVTTTTIGIGDITTIWSPLSDISFDDAVQSALCVGIESAIQQDFAINFCEQAMQKLYNDRTGRNTKNALTKKQIPKIAAKVEDSGKAEELLRTAMKAGPGMHRIVDSSDAVKTLYNMDDDQADSRTALQQRLVSAEVLSSDARLGGRFKRMPCSLVAADISDAHQQITVMNGGWLAVDSGNRAGAEARKLVERSAANVDNNISKDSAQTSSSPLLTAADERIANRLECMAMGEISDIDASSSDATSSGDDTRIEVDVREVLRAMKLPVSATGAKDALIRMGWWTEGSSGSGNQNASVEPWPSNVLDAAASLVEFEKQRKQQLSRQCQDSKIKTAQNMFEGRINLSAVPCVCADAKGTAFRDDAIGVRPRSSTGRKVTDASKWEILLHISDVSDIFSPNLGDLGVPYDPISLRRAAEKRGYSRYDLPLGPLHLMPPVALKALALEPATGTEAASNRVINRCVTLWAYIDERTGELVDAGLERSITSAPIPFTYASATSLLDGNISSDKMTAEMQKARSIFALAERNLLLWSEHQRQTNDAAARRHERMAARQIISDATSPLDTERGEKKFQYSRGHRVVDLALDLYGYALKNLLKRAKAQILNAPGQGGDRRGRLGTAPLRRYVDAMAQRQALSALCNYGGPPLTKKECNVVYQAAAKASDAIKTVRSRKKDKSANDGAVSQRQDRTKLLKTLQRLEGHLARIGTNGSGNKQVVRALSTGRENEVVLEGIGLTVKCTGVDGTLKPGEKCLVHIVKIDPVKGQLRVKLASRAKSEE